MIKPVSKDGKVNKDSRFTYRIPTTKRGASIPITGYLVPATFKVTGWRHPIEFVTTNSLKGDRITIQRITIGSGDGSWSYTDDGDQPDIYLDRLPIGKIFDAALKACAFTATIPARKINKRVKSDLPFMRITELDTPPLMLTIGGEPTNDDRAILLRKSDDRSDDRSDGRAIDDPQSLKAIARHYNEYKRIGKIAAGSVTIARYLEMNIGKPQNTCQQMISMCRKAGYLPKQTKRKRVK